MTDKVQIYLQRHPSFVSFLKQNPLFVEELMLFPEHLEQLKLHYREQKNRQWIQKIQNMTMLLSVMGMTNDQ